LHQFNQDLFFNILIPPIIFEAGYHLRTTFFFANFWVIMSYAVIGTILNNAIIASVLTALGGIMISAPRYIDGLVFGRLCV
jgi:NhaP-type Na+/H+ or K+/H+ antiporter